MGEKVDNRLLSQAMLLDGMYPGIVEKWAAQAAALESELALLRRNADFLLWIKRAAEALDRWFDKGVMHAAPPGDLTADLRDALAAWKGLIKEHPADPTSDNGS